MHSFVYILSNILCIERFCKRSGSTSTGGGRGGGEHCSAFWNIRNRSAHWLWVSLSNITIERLLSTFINIEANQFTSIQNKKKNNAPRPRETAPSLPQGLHKCVHGSNFSNIVQKEHARVIKIILKYKN